MGGGSNGPRRRRLRVPEPVVSVVAPAFNEEAGIEKNVRDLLAALDALPGPAELIVVNDGSTDGTLARLRKAESHDARLRVISYAPNRGRGYALRQGFRAALGEIVITTESDLSWGAGIVSILHQALAERGLDMVIASPYLPGGRLENVPFVRAFLSRFGNAIMTRAFSGNLTMVSGMTRAYRKEVLDSMDLESDGKEIHLEIVSKALSLGYRIGEVPAVLRWEPPRAGAPRRRSSFRAGRYIVSHLLASFGESPFLLFGGVGAALLAVGIVLGLYAWYIALAYDIRVTTRPILFAAILFTLFGTQMLVFSFLANQSRDLRNRLVRMEQKLLRLLNDREKKQG